jgi:hypothetical protein
MAAMPELLTGPTHGRLLPASCIRGGDVIEYGQTVRPDDALEEALKALEGMNQKNWKKVRDAVADQIRQAKKWMDVRIVIE